MPGYFLEATRLPFETNREDAFLKSYLTIYIDKGFREMGKKTLANGAGDRILFTTPVRELATKEIVTASQQILCGPHYPRWGKCVGVLSQ
jgi:hypothetical protein